MIFLGLFFGTITGLFPGIHVNIIAFFILIYFDFLENIFKDKFLLIVFILVMGLTHTFIDFIPSIFFGIVDETSSISLMPSQKLILNKKSLDAIYYSSWGSFLGGLISFILILFLLIFLKKIYIFFNPLISYFLIIVSILLILTEKTIIKIIWTIIISLFSGGIGLLLLNSNHITNPLLILFIGIFSLPAIFDILIRKNKNKSSLEILKKQNFFLCSEINVPKICQEIKKNLMSKNKKGMIINLKYFNSIIITSFFSLISSISPGISSSISAIFTSFFINNLKDEIKVFLISMNV
jgi:putative membrane protein